ncbi:MAG: sigma 54-interacting transcriptional regulator, partial [Acidobacteriota bacterium]|nr:sigma 54-interacting transcriptional regulator [Acidobacteriota bacterium]
YRGQSLFEMFFLVSKTALLSTFEEHEAAAGTALKARRVIDDYTGTIWDQLRVFYHALSVCARLDEGGLEPGSEMEARLDRWKGRMAWWAENCPENFEAQHRIVAAEIARARGRTDEAIAGFEAALEAGARQECPRESALAAELYGRFWLRRGRMPLAAHFFSQSIASWAAWGATAKAQALALRHGDLLSRPDAVRAPAQRAPATIDAFTALKAAHAISGEIELEKLVKKLVKIAIESAGAERGILLREEGDSLFVAAEGSTDSEDARIPTLSRLEDRPDLAHAIVRLVRRTGENVLVGDAASDPRWLYDPYVARERPRSILCVPIVHQGRRTGLLYLENNLAAEAFSPERIETIQVIAAQAAIGLENARLYEEMRAEVARRRQAEEEVTALSARVAAAAERYRSLLEINNAIVSNLKQTDLFHAIAGALRRVLPFDRTAIFLHDPEKSVLRLFLLESSLPSTPYFAVGLEMDPGRSHVGLVFRERRYLLRNDLQTEREYPTEDLLLEDGLRSLVVVPLTARGRVIGTLDVTSTLANRYSDVDAEFLHEAANQIGLAVENMRSYEEIASLKKRLEDENLYLQEEIKTQHNFEEIIGTSRPLQRVLAQVETVATTDSTILIGGETGTGKELVARAIHNMSRRRDRPIIKVNCAALPGGLIESELFGHEKGAFTGAIARRIGRFELADGGTIFLDEIGDVPPEAQSKLLRVLQEREIERVGGMRAISVDVRVIAATNRDLEQAVSDGAFRADLYYRLSVFPIRLPSLRERSEDIPLLVRYFANKYAARVGKKIERVSQATLTKLAGYGWPGNIRELENVIERAVILSTSPILEIGDELLGKDHRTSSASSAGSTLQDIEKRHILETLKSTRWVVEGPSGAARILAMHPNTLRSRMSKLGILRPSTHEMS